MKKIAILVASAVVFPLCLLAEESGGKVIAIGDVDAGYEIGGGKAYDVKETIQLGLKKEIEKMGKGQYTVNIVAPAVVSGKSEPEPAALPEMPANRAPTQKEMAQYIAAMQQFQKEMSGQVKRHKPVAADAYFEFKVQGEASETTTYGTGSSIGDYTGHYTPMSDLGVKSTKVYLVATQRDPKTGTLIDKHTAKATSVKFRNVAGYTSYHYGSDEITRENLFKSAIKDCAKWIVGQVK